MIAGLGNDRVIGKASTLLWRIPDDLKRFKELTLGHPIIMGRKTFDSIGKVLPGRTSIVITRDKEFTFTGVVVTHSLEEALERAKEIEKKEIFIIGGAQIYEQALPVADLLYLTLIDDEKEGDTSFPQYENIFTKKLSEERREWNGLVYYWIDLERP